MIHDPKETFTTPKNQDIGVFQNKNAFNTNFVDLDAGKSPIMAKELQQLR